MSEGDHGAAYDHGWYARERGEVFKAHASQDWKDGYNDCAEVQEQEAMA